MTDLLYQTDAYIQDFDAEIIAIDEAANAVLLDQTAFYPGGGGQPADRGLLSSGSMRFPVERARKGPEGIWHELTAGSQLPAVHTPVHGILDWSHRYSLMRTHTAMHILCGVVFRDYGALVTGGDMEPLHGRMDFEFESLSKDLVGVIDEAVNREVQAARPIKVAILPRAKALEIPDLIRTKINLVPPEISHIRTIELVGLDLQADGGTHVANTSEVGRMHIVDYKSKGRINKRIYIELEG